MSEAFRCNLTHYASFMFKNKKEVCLRDDSWLTFVIRSIAESEPMWIAFLHQSWYTACHAAFEFVTFKVEPLESLSASGFMNTLLCFSVLHSMTQTMKVVNSQWPKYSVVNEWNKYIFLKELFFIQRNNNVELAAKITK